MNFSLRQIIVYGLIFCIGIAAAMLANQYKRKQAILNTRNTVPDLSVYGIRGIDSGLGAGKRMVLVYFNPECTYCENEIREIADQGQEIQDVDYVLISTGDEKSTQELLDQYGLVEGKDIVLGYDDADRFYQQFATRVIPSTLLYNAKGELIKDYKGEVSFSVIQKQFDDAD